MAADEGQAWHERELRGWQAVLATIGVVLGVGLLGALKGLTPWRGWQSVGVSALVGLALGAMIIPLAILRDRRREARARPGAELRPMHPGQPEETRGR